MVNPIDASRKPSAVETFRQQANEAFNSEDKQLHVKFNLRKTQAFLIKGDGPGKSKASRMWFALRHPQVSGRNPTAQKAREDLLLALKTAAKKDLGPEGPKLVEKHMQAANTSKLKQSVVNDIANEVQVRKHAEAFEKACKARGVDAQGLTQAISGAYGPQGGVSHMMGTPQGVHLLKVFATDEMSAENIDFLVRAGQAKELLGDKAPPAVKRAAFKALVETYVKTGADQEINISSAMRDKVMAFMSKPDAFEGDHLREANQLLDELTTGVSKNVRDTFVRFKQPKKVESTLQQLWKSGVDFNKPLLPPGTVKTEADSALKATVMDSSVPVGQKVSEFVHVFALQKPEGRSEFLSAFQKNNGLSHREMEGFLVKVGKQVGLNQANVGTFLRGDNPLSISARNHLKHNHDFLKPMMEDLTSHMKQAPVPEGGSKAFAQAKAAIHHLSESAKFIPTETRTFLRDLHEAFNEPEFIKEFGKGMGDAALTDIMLLRVMNGELGTDRETMPASKIIQHLGNAVGQNSHLSNEEIVPIAVKVIEEKVLQQQGGASSDEIRAFVTPELVGELKNFLNAVSTSNSNS